MKSAKKYNFNLRRPRVRAVLVPIAAISLAACGATGKAPTKVAPSSKPSAIIIIKDFKYYPSTLVVMPRETVTVLNKDVATHSVTAQPGLSGQAPVFNTGNIPPGSQATFKAPTTKGTYPYICDIHSFMHGTLIVK